MKRQWLKRALALVAGWMVVTAAAGAGAGAQQGMNPRFVLRAGGAEVYDKKTDLTWQRCSYGTRWQNGSGCVGIIKEVNWDTARSLANGAWRLPSKEELVTLIDPEEYCGEINLHSYGTRSSPPGAWNEFLRSCGGYKNRIIDPEAFPDIEKRTSAYWSGTDGGAPIPWLDGGASAAWLVFFGNGYAGNYPRSYPEAVRLVRGGQ